MERQQSLQVETRHILELKKWVDIFKNCHLEKKILEKALSSCKENVILEKQTLSKQLKINAELQRETEVLRKKLEKTCDTLEKTQKENKDIKLQREILEALNQEYRSLIEFTVNRPQEEITSRINKLDSKKKEKNSRTTNRASTVSKRKSKLENRKPIRTSTRTRTTTKKRVRPRTAAEEINTKSKLKETINHLNGRISLLQSQLQVCNVDTNTGNKLDNREKTGCHVTSSVEKFDEAKVEIIKAKSSLSSLEDKSIEKLYRSLKSLASRHDDILQEVLHLRRQVVSLKSENQKLRSNMANLTPLIRTEGIEYSDASISAETLTQLHTPSLSPTKWTSTEFKSACENELVLKVEQKRQNINS